MTKKIVFVSLCLVGLTFLLIVNNHDRTGIVEATADVQAVAGNVSETQDANTAAAICKEADEFYKNDDFEQARELFQYVVAQYPSSEYAMWGQCGVINSSIQLGEDSNIQTEIDNLITKYSAHKDIVWAVHYIVYTYRDLQKEEQAEQVYQKIVKKWPACAYAASSQEGVAISNILQADDANAQAAIDKLLTESTRDSHLAEAIWNIVQGYCDSNQPNKAKEVYLSAINGWPEDEQTIWPQMIEAVSNIHLGNDTKAQSAIARLKENFQGNTYFAEVMWDIASAYYLQGRKSVQGKPDSYSEFFEKSLAVLEDGALSESISNDVIKANINYLAGLNLYLLSDYPEAAEAFRRVPEIFPRHTMADYCTYQAGYCYEKLIDSNAISQAEGEAFIESQYTQLIKNYPESVLSRAAKAWLQRKERAITISSCAGKGAN